MKEKETATTPLQQPLEPEPEHGCCTRILFVPLALGSLIPAAAFLIFEAISAPIQFAILLCCKLTICNCCCPDSIHHCFRNVICSPCRWMRISCTGKGHIVCWKHPAWPFRDSK